MNKKMIIAILSGIFSIGGLILEFISSGDEEERINKMVDKAVEERLKNAK